MKITMEKNQILEELEIKQLKTMLATLTTALIAQKKIVAALKESHRDLLMSYQAKKAVRIREDEQYQECKNAEQRDAYLRLAFIETDSELRVSEKDISKADLELDIVQDNLKCAKYQARLVVAELQFLAD